MKLPFKESLSLSFSLGCLSLKLLLLLLLLSNSPLSGLILCFACLRSLFGFLLSTVPYLPYLHLS